MQTQSLFAAIDLGSNSFRLEIGQLEAGQLRRVEYIKETVRQGNGLDAERNLSQEAMQRGWDCLARFRERIADFSAEQVRAVATQTLREARNRDVFLSKAKRILGFPIEVIAGREEARLIYLGVSHLLPQSPERRLVIDIGGRSTELILGQNETPSTMESYRVGSVAWSMKYFADGVWSNANFKAAEIAAKAVLDEAQIPYNRNHWDICYGSSGTVGAVCDVLGQAGWPQGLVTREGLDWLKEKLIKAQRMDNLRLDNIKEDRRPVIGGGLSVLRALFDLLQIDEMRVASGGLRHGLLYELMGHDHEQADVRAKSVDRLAVKFGADATHGERVARVATLLLAQLQAGSTDLTPMASERLHRKLAWAATLHEIGSHISHSDYHKHGAYILDQSDALGFTQSELHKLSLLVLGHRGKLRKLEADFTDIPFVHQLLALRLAVILCHARRDPVTEGLFLSAPRKASNTFELQYAQGWDRAFPQSAHLLREEILAWQKTPWAFELREQSNAM